MLGWAFENEGSNDTRSMAISKMQEKNKYDASLGGPFKISNKSAYFVGLGVGNTHNMQCFSRLDLRKHNNATMIFPPKSQKAVNALFAAMGRLTHSKLDVLLN